MNNHNIVANELKKTEKYKESPFFTPISRIMNLETSVPAKYRVNATVVDHIPFSIKDFRRPVCQDCHKSFEVQVQSCDDCDCTDIRLEYMFSLLLSDGTGYMPAIVSGKEATTFFRNISASDATIPGLQDLVSNLWTLPGDSRDPRVRNAKEFECIVETFHVEYSGLEKLRIKLCDTVIPINR